MEPANTKWKISCGPLQEWKLRIGDWFPLNAWFTEDGDFCPDQCTSATNNFPSSSQWIHCLDSGWTFPSLHSLPISTACPKPLTDTPVAHYSMYFNSISSPSNLPQFTSLFKLTLSSGKSTKRSFKHMLKKIMKQQLCWPLKCELYGINLICWNKSWLKS